MGNMCKKKRQTNPTDGQGQREKWKKFSIYQIPEWQMAFQWCVQGFCNTMWGDRTEN